MSPGALIVLILLIGIGMTGKTWPWVVLLLIILAAASQHGFGLRL